MGINATKRRKRRENQLRQELKGNRKSKLRRHRASAILTFITG
jgi:hypothetical protein